MKKFNINGKDYIKLSELRHEIKRLKETISIRHGGFSERMINAVKVGYGDIIRAIYKEELEEALKHANTPEEIKAVHESIYDMPGEFIVYRRTDKPKTFHYFTMWSSGKAVVSENPEAAMVFSYQSKAEEIAETLGDGWQAMDISEESIAESKRLLKAIFDERDDDDDEESEYTKDDAEEILGLLSEFLEKSDADDDAKERLFDVVSENIHRVFGEK